ncbi:MAG: hypothetical protein OET57_14780, partial [Desulfobacteraceae bacterium]|nr:hypothetical protein [Desulfobacteraceae bacterium]
MKNEGDIPVNMQIDVNKVKIGVVGAGSWGTALTNLLASKGFKIDLWVFEKEVKEQIESYRENKVFLPGISLSDHISPSNDIETVVKGK